MRYLNHIRKISNSFFKILLSIQLCLAPSLSYATVPSNTENFLKEDPFVQNMISQYEMIIHEPDILNKDEMIIHEPDILNKFDYWLLFHQIAYFLSYPYNTSTNDFQEQVDAKTDFHSNKVVVHQGVFTKVKTSYDQASKSLIFEGISEGKPLVRHEINHLDIIDYTNDDDMLILLDRDKGLLLIDMAFVQGALGRTPIPLIRVSVSNKNLRELIDRKAPLSLEFVHIKTRPPDDVKEDVDITRAFNQERIFTAGDLMISHSNHNKTLIQLIPRDELTKWMQLHYELLNMMTLTLSFEVISENLEEVREEIYRQFLKAVSITVLPEIKKILHPLLMSTSQIRSSQPKEPFQLTDEEWKRLFTHKDKDLVGSEKLTPEDITKYSRTLKIMKKGVHFINHHKKSFIATGTLLGLEMIGMPIAQSIIQVVNYSLSSVAQSVSSLEAYENYVFTSLPSVITMLAGLPLIFLFIAGSAVPVAKLLASDSLIFQKLLAKVFHRDLKGMSRDFIEKWGKTNIIQKIIGFGMQFVAFSIEPFPNKMFHVTNREGALNALKQDLNPFQKIDHQSKIGKLAGLSKDMRVGGKWGKNDPQVQKLQAILRDQKYKTDAIALALTIAAMSSKEIPLEQMIQIIEGEDPAIVGELIKALNSKKNAIWQALWIKKQLSEKIDVEDIYEITSKQIQFYYTQAQELAKKPISKKSLLKLKLKYKLQMFKPSNLTSINENQIKLLKNIPNDFVKDRVFTEFITDHLMVVLLPIFATDRAWIGVLEQLHVMAPEISGGWNSGQHMNDIAMNVIGHFFIAGAQRSLVYTASSTTIQNAYNKVMNQYDFLTLNKDIEFREKSQSMLQYMSKNISGAFASGGKVDNLGNRLWGGYIARLRTIQMTFILFTTMRLIAGDDQGANILASFALFHFSATWIFGWPWDVLALGAKNNEHYLNENKEQIQDTLNELSKISRGMYSTHEEIHLASKKVIEKIGKILGDKEFKKIVEEITKLMVSSDPTALSDPIEAQKQAQILLQKMQNQPILATKNNEFAKWNLTFFFGAVLTTYLAIALIIWTFDPKHLTLENLFVWAAISYGAFFLLYQVYKRSLTDHLIALKNSKKRVVEKGKRVTKKIINSCKQVFSKKSP